MPLLTDSLFAMPAARALLDQELATLAPQLAGLYGQQGLFVRAHAHAPKVVSAPMLGRLVRLHVEAPEFLGGDATCSIRSLPFSDDSFRLVLVQHAAERLADGPAFQEEIARVLAPEGLAIIIGFSALSPWRGWIARQERDSGAPLHLTGPAQWRRALARHGVDAYALRRVGSVWPREQAPESLPLHHATLTQKLLDPLRASFVLLARKRREATTPLRLRSAAEITLSPRLAPGAQRACA